MFLRANKYSALVVLLFIVVAAFYVESRAGRKRFLARKFPSVVSHDTERNHMPSAARKALKKGWYFEDESLSDPVRAESRNLSSKGQRVEFVGGNFRLVSLPRLILAPKVATNLFLSVLNL